MAARAAYAGRGRCSRLRYPCATAHRSATKHHSKKATIRSGRQQRRTPGVERRRRQRAYDVRPLAGLTTTWIVAARISPESRARLRPNKSAPDPVIPGQGSIFPLRGGSRIRTWAAFATDLQPMRATRAELDRDGAVAASPPRIPRMPDDQGRPAINLRPRRQLEQGTRQVAPTPNVRCMHHPR
jgi:hypothetical protein